MGIRQPKNANTGTISRVHASIVSTRALRSGQLARLTGISVDTLHHYEKLGVLPTSQRTSGGYRMFLPSSVERIQLAQRALQLGFSLKELSEIFRIQDRGDVPCLRVLTLTEEKLRSVGRQIRELRRTQVYIRKLVHDWRQKLEHTPSL
jgi:MerR family transcriptional regulator, copper efflux regulator